MTYGPTLPNYFTMTPQGGSSAVVANQYYRGIAADKRSWRMTSGSVAAGNFTVQHSGINWFSANASKPAIVRFSGTTVDYNFEWDPPFQSVVLAGQAVGIAPSPYYELQ